MRQKLEQQVDAGHSQTARMGFVHGVNNWTGGLVVPRDAATWVLWFMATESKCYGVRC